MIRLLIAAATALLVAIVGTWYLIEALSRHRIGQPIREDGPQGHAVKAGTPTMGGLAIVGGAALGYTISDLYNGVYTRTGLLVMGAIVGGGAVGLMDDWIKVVQERNLGLNKRAKTLGLVVVAVVFATLMVQFTTVDTSLAFTRPDLFGLELGRVGWTIWAVVLIYASANAVNLTDGLDGLAAGSAILSFAAFVVVSFWQFRNEDLYGLPHSLDTAVVAAAMMGACIGFLWWNAAPAQIFMGDTGSLAIGTGLAALALVTDTHLLLPILGALFVIETLSVIIQVTAFRLQGTRVFRMAPIHHHFELGGWPETRVIIRLWVLHGLCVAVGIGLFYSDWVNLTEGVGPGAQVAP